MDKNSVQAQRSNQARLRGSSTTTFASDKVVVVEKYSRNVVDGPSIVVVVHRVLQVVVVVEVVDVVVDALVGVVIKCSLNSTAGRRESPFLMTITATTPIERAETIKTITDKDINNIDILGSRPPVLVPRKVDMQLNI